MSSNVPDLTEQQLEYLGRLPADKIREWLKPRPKPKPLALPAFAADEVKDPLPELVQAVESALADLLHLSRYISTGGVEPGSREARDLIWQLDVKKAEFLPLAGKLRTISPNEFTRICSGYEWLFLSPYASERPASDPRTKAITDKFCADRSFGRDERPHRTVEPKIHNYFNPELP